MAKQWIRAGILGMVAVAGTARYSQAEPASIPVKIENLAGATTAEIRDAQRVAGNIFKAAGITIVWVEQLDGGDPRIAQLVTVVLPARAIAESLARKNNSIGFTPVRLDIGPVIYVFANRAEEEARRCDQPVKFVLGTVIAHELGHLLMPGQPHAASGIMHAVLGQKEFAVASRQGLLFAATEADLMRTALTNRLSALAALGR